MPRLISRKTRGKVGFIVIYLGKWCVFYNTHLCLNYKVFYCNKNKKNWLKMTKRSKNILRTFEAHFGKNLRTLRLSHFFNVLIKKRVYPRLFVSMAFIPYDALCAAFPNRLGHTPQKNILYTFLSKLD